MSLHSDIVGAINSNNAESGSNTPDFILAEYLTACLAAFDKATYDRDTWHSKPCTICGNPDEVTATHGAEPIALG